MFVPPSLLCFLRLSVPLHAGLLLLRKYVRGNSDVAMIWSIQHGNDVQGHEKARTMAHASSTQFLLRILFVLCLGKGWEGHSPSSC